MSLVKLGGQEGEDFNFQEYKETPAAELVELGILPDIPGLYSWDTDNSLVDGVLISHAHKDHYGSAQYRLCMLGGLISIMAIRQTKRA